MLSDTHIGPGGPRRLPDVVYDELERAEAILHAGDVVTGELLDELEGFAPVHAVLGNNDRDLFGVLPETREVLIGGVHIGLVHDSGSTVGRDARLARRFPAARIVVYGHSHAPENREVSTGQLLFNPGSPTQRRRQPHPTYGVLELADSRLVGHSVFVVPDAR